ncbi:MAG: hypothetical protein DRQ43_11265, partial [Gammaproteobacteria bacterium]
NTTNIPNLDLSATPGADVRFTDAVTGNELKYEVESWDAGADTATIWVKVPKIDAGSATDYIYVYHDYDGTATYDQVAADEQAVWGAGTGVYHLDEDPDAGGADEMLDSDGTANHGTADATMDSGDLVGGRIGNAIHFNGDSADNNITFASTDLGDTFTISLWVNPTLTGANQTLVTNKDVTGTGGDGFKLITNDGGIIKFVTSNGSSADAAVTLAGVINFDQWNHVAVEVNRTAGMATIFHNGIDVTDPSNKSIFTDFQVNSDWLIGNRVDDSDEFKGELDELRVETVTRSADWIKASYESQKDGATFASFGSEEAAEVATTDKAAPVILSKETADLDGDGFIDAIHVTFSEAIDDSTVVAGDFDVAGVTGETFSSTTNGDIANDADIYITFNDGVLDTGATPDVTYTQGTLADLSGNLLDSSDSSWLSADWLNRAQITFNNINSSEDLENFPVLVTLNKTDIPGLDLSATVGADVRFTDANGTELKYEVESWDDVAETATIWVKVPTITAGSTSDYINVYYNYNGTATYDQIAADEEAVWNTSYAGVWHLDGLLDSTSNSNDGTDSGTTVDIAGKTGQARSWDTDSLVSMGSGASLDNLSAFTFSTWVKQNDSSSDPARRLFEKRSAAGESKNFYIAGDNRLEYIQKTSGTQITKDSLTLVNDTWYHITLTSDGTLNESGVNIYVDGELANGGGSNGSGSVLDDSGGDLWIGSRNDNGRSMQGIMDEVSMSNVVRTADWIKASYLSQNGSFASFGSEAAAGVATTDKAAPVILSAAATEGSDQVTVTFSEAVDTSNAGAGDLVTGDFNYTDVSGGGAGAISSMGADADGTDNVVTITLDANFTAGDNNT